MRTHVALFLAMSVLIFSIISSPVLALERELRWDTRAEFDSGLKSNISGHVGLETYTDNPAWKRGTRAPEEGLYASSAWGDDFRLPDSDAETWKFERPVASDCDDNGAEWITNADPVFTYVSPSSGGTINQGIDTGNGAMVFMHNGTLRNSTRTTTTTFAEGQQWRIGMDLQNSIWGISNFTFLLSSISPSETSTRFFCGGYNSSYSTEVWGAGFWLRKTILTDIGPGLFSLSAFTLQAGVIRPCGGSLSYEPNATHRFRIERSFTSFTFALSPSPEPDSGPYPPYIYIGTCLFNSTDSQALRLWSTFDFVSTSGIGGTALMHLYKNMQQGFYIATDHYAFPPSNGEANWTSPSTGGAPADRPIFVRIEAEADIFGVTSLCGFALFLADSWTIAYQPASWNVCISPGGPTQVFQSDIGSIALDGPYRFRFGMIGDRTSWNRINSVNMTIQYTPVLPPPVQGEAHPPAILANLTGIAVFCGVGAAIFIVLLALLRRVKNS